MKKFQRDKLDYVGKDLVMQRLTALAYIDSNGNYVNDDGSTTGTATSDQLASLQGNLSSGVDTPTSGAPQVFGPPSPTSSPTVTPQTASGGGNLFAGLSEMFSAVGSGIGHAYTAINPTAARPTTLPGQVGSYVYNPATGQYLPAVQGATPVASSSMMLLLGLGLIALVFALKHD